jgi:hypothetical protein
VSRALRRPGRPVPRPAPRGPGRGPGTDAGTDAGAGPALPRDPANPARPGPAERRGWRRGLAGEWPVLVPLVPAAVIHGLVLAAYRPALWLLGDSISYLNEGVHVRPDPWRPIGYSILLFLLRPLHSLLAVSVTQHVLALLLGVLVYAATRRLGGPRWLAALAAVPVLFDGYLLALDQSLLSDAPFTLILFGGLLLVVLWPGRPPVWACLLGGLCLGAADVTRTAGLPVIVLVVLYLLLRRVGLVRLVGVVVTAALPVLLYSAWYQRDYGEFTTSPTGLQLYGHVMQYVDCSTLPHRDFEQTLCHKAPAGQQDPEDWYVFSPRSPLYRLPGDWAARDREARSFDLMVIKHQPLGYFHLVADVLGSYFGTGVHAVFWYHLEQRYPVLPPQAVAAGRAYTGGPAREPQPTGGLGAFLHGYQNAVYVPGPGYLALLLLALAGWIFGRDPERRGLRGLTGLLALSGLALMAFPAFAVPVEERYRVPALPLLSLAAVLGVMLLAGRVREWGRAVNPRAVDGRHRSAPGRGSAG